MVKKGLIIFLLISDLLLVIFFIDQFIYYQNNVSFFNNMYQSFLSLDDPKLNYKGEFLIGKEFVNFVLNDIHSKKCILKEIKSKIKIVVLFNIYDCGTCLSEYRLWNKIQTTFPRDKVSVIGICNNTELNDVLNFISIRSINFPILHDPKNIVRSGMGFRRSPLRITIDEKNVIKTIEVPDSSIQNQKQYLYYLSTLLLEGG